MKKPSGTDKRACLSAAKSSLAAWRSYRARTSGAARAVSLAGLALAAGLSLSCDLFTYKRPFPDAYYEDNFIADIGFDRFVGDQGLAAIPVDPLTGALVPVTGSWDFAYRYDPGWTGDVDYMNLTDLTAATGETAADFGTVPDGLSATAPVYRLELANLVTGGDFEGGAIGSEWSFGSTITEPDPSRALLAGGGSIQGTSLQVDFSSSDQFALYSIQDSLSTLVAGTGLDSNALYLFRFTANCASILAALREEGLKPIDKDTSGLLDFTKVNEDDVTKLISFTFNPATTGTDYLRFQRNNDSTLLLDDISLTRSDLNLQLRLRLTHYQSDPNLESFLYRFSYWVNEDVFANPANEAEEPWRLDVMTGDIQALYGVPTLPGHQSETYEYDASSTGWQKHTAYFIDKLTLPAQNSKTEAVLELSIDLSASLPGRVLIAQPELRCYPDGY